MEDTKDTVDCKEIECNNKRWDTKAKIVTIITSIVFGGAAIVFSALNLEKSRRDEARDSAAKCVEYFKTSLEISSKYTGTKSDLRSALQILMGECPQNEKIDVLVSLAKEPAQPGKPEPLPNADTVRGPEKWVALGFVNDDGNFTSTTGKKLEALTAGDTARATTEVNVRKKAADWNTPIATVKTGEIVVIEEVKRLKAGNLEQIWARIK